MDKAQIRKAFESLAKTEDTESFGDPILLRLTGLTLKQIMELKERDTAKMCKQSIFDHDSITCACGSDMDKDVEFMFCPWCGQRLKKWGE